LVVGGRNSITQPSQIPGPLAAIKTLMFKQTFILISFLLTVQFLLGQNSLSNDNQILSTLVKSEITVASKSIVVVKRIVIDSSSISWVTEALKSKNAQQLEQLRFLTRDDNGKSVSSIDTATQNLILEFYSSKPNGPSVTNLVDSSLKIFYLDISPFKNGSNKEWQLFYKRYPKSGGLFQFSNVYFSQDGSKAIVYHSLLRNGLNGHGALVVFTKVNGGWKIRYHINLWQA